MLCIETFSLYRISITYIYFQMAKVNFVIKKLLLSSKEYTRNGLQNQHENCITVSTQNQVKKKKNHLVQMIWLNSI